MHKRKTKSTMSLIKKPTEIMVASTVKCLIYGQAGTGKSTLALSAPKPLYLDFDTSVSRLNAVHRVPTVQIQSWTDIQAVVKEDLSDYDSIVIDTVGKMLDYIMLHVCGTAQPKIQQWGKINQEFTWFCRILNSLNKNIIFVAHRGSRKEGDNTIFVPDIREKNYNAIVTELDLMGYIESKDNKRTITFDFSDRNDGKNTCNLPQFISVPTIVDDSGNATAQNNFFETGILAGFKKRLEQQVRITQQYKECCTQIDESLELVEDAMTANAFMNGVILNKNYQHIGSSLVYARRKFSAKVGELKLEFNKEKKEYEDAQQG